MIAQITPLVQAAGRRTWLSATASHMLGSALSGSFLGFILGAVGLAIGLERWIPLTTWVLVFVLLFCGLRDAGIVKWRLPSLRRQTPAWCPRVLGMCWGAFAWGVDLGQGWTTLISFAGYYVLVLWAVLNASPIQGVLLLGAYGLGRALPVFVAGLKLQKANIASRSIWHVEHQSMLYKINAAALAFAAGYFLFRQ